MNAPFLTRRMTVEEFLAWSDARAAALPYDEPKWELFDGVPEMQEHERWAHARIKYKVMRALEEAISRAGIPLEAGIDGLGVRVGAHESYQPEVVVFPAGRISDDDRLAPDPVIVVEVLSPSTRSKDLNAKAKGCGRVASLLHYLVVDPDTRHIVHFRRQGVELVADAEPIGKGQLRLDPPGLEVAIAEFFAS